MIYAKPSTSLLVVFRAYLASDHVTPATGKTIAITISKNGGAFGNPNAGATNATEISSGFYKVTLDTTDTGTAGPLAVRGAEGTIDDVGAIFYVGQAPADVTHFGGTAATASGGRPEVNTTHAAGTAWGSGAITAASIAADAITAAKIADGAIDANTFAAGAITASAIAADAITDAKVAADVTIASVTGAVGSVTGNVGGNVAGSVGSIATGGIAAASFAAGAIDAAAIAANAIGASELAADAVAEIQSGLATQASVDTIDDFLDTEVAAILAAVDTEVAAIKAKTDNLPSDPADASDVAAAFSALSAKVDAVDDLLDTEMPALTAAVADIPTNAELATALAAADDAVLAAIAALNNLSAAQVNAEVVDALRTDTGTEVSAVPAAAAPIAAQLQLLYQALRNKIDVTNTAKEIHTDAGAVVGTKTLSDDATTYSETKMA